MKAKSRESRQGNFLYPDLLEQLNPTHPLLKLGKRIPWQRFEDEFAGLYSQAGRPAKPVRLIEAEFFALILFCLFTGTKGEPSRQAVV